MKNTTFLLVITHAVNSSKAESRIYTLVLILLSGVLGLRGVMPKVWEQGSKKNFCLLHFFFLPDCRIYRIVLIILC